MAKNKYNVLVTNDDGYQAGGIRALVEAIGSWNNVYLVAPKEQNSGMSQRLTFRKDLEISKIDVPKTVEAYAFDGTPADCVKWGLQHYEAKGLKFDFVLSGINLGGNAGASVYYSGTLGAAREASIHGYHAIAMSVVSHEATHFESITTIVKDLFKASEKLPTSTILSVGAPNIPLYDIKGRLLVSCAEYGYGDDYVLNDIGDNKFRYGHRVVGAPLDEKSTKIKYDFDAIQAGYVAITPITSRVQDADALMVLQGLANSDTLTVFIDLQEKLMPAMRKGKKLEDNLVKFAKCLERLDAPVLVTEQYSRGLGYTIQSIRNALGDFEKVDKISFNCLAEKSFRKAIEGMSSRKVILCGIEAHICLQQTAEEFLNRGYEVVIPKNCCGSRNKEDYETAMHYLASKGCKITTWESVIYEMLGSSAHPAFRKISEIVKGE